MERPLISILSIAGSDSSAGAGIQADIKAAAACGIYCTTAITAVTAQSTGGVESIIILDPKDVKAQILAIIKDQVPDAIKIGMIGSVGIGHEILNILGNELKGIPVVVDPVLGSTSGKSFSDNGESLIDFYKKYLLPLATIATPNVNEASLLTDSDLIVEDEHTQTIATRFILSELGCRSVVLKGGHSKSKYATDMLALRLEDGTIKTSAIGSLRFNCDNLHGTGCTYSTFLACGLAKGMGIEDAFKSASHKIKKVIAESCHYSYGSHRNGPLNIFGFRQRDCLPD